MLEHWRLRKRSWVDTANSSYKVSNQIEDNANKSTWLCTYVVIKCLCFLNSDSGYLCCCLEQKYWGVSCLNPIDERKLHEIIIMRLFSWVKAPIDEFCCPTGSLPISHLRMQWSKKPGLVLADPSHARGFTIQNYSTYESINHRLVGKCHSLSQW